MRKLFSFLCVALAVIALFSSCNKKETYPSHLSGTWSYANPSTGYQGTLVIENIAGGQAATLEVITPIKETYVSFKGSLQYDMNTGIGIISSTMLGAPTVKVQANKGKNTDLNVTVRQMVAGGTDTIFEGVFTTAK